MIAENLLPLLLTSAAAPLSCRSVLLLPLLDMPRRRTDQARDSTRLLSCFGGVMWVCQALERRCSGVGNVAGDAVLCF